MPEGVEIVVHVVQGRVQGVGYRAFVSREAERHCLQGWVRNCRDGSVEALFKGEAEPIEDIIVACRRGPPGARVDAVHRRDGTEAEMRARVAGEDFSLLPTL